MKKKTRRECFSRIARGLALVILGILLLCSPTSCGRSAQPEAPGQSEWVVLNGDSLRIVQGTALRLPSPAEGTEYVFIPLTLENGGEDIIFSTRACQTVHALPSGMECPHSSGAVECGRERVKGFRLPDGIIRSGQKTSCWLALELPEGSSSARIDMVFGTKADECVSFECKI